MILMKSALSSILVVLGACDRASVDASPPPGPSASAAAPSASAAAEPATIAVASASAPKAAPPVAKASPGRVKTAAKTVYVCPMHPEVVSDVPGLCPKCNMKLDPKPQVTEVREERPEAPAVP